MTDSNSGGSSNTLQIILIPSVITLGVTILRLVGELNNWSDFWFSQGARWRLSTNRHYLVGIRLRRSTLPSG